MANPILVHANMADLAIAARNQFRQEEVNSANQALSFAHAQHHGQARTMWLNAMNAARHIAGLAHQQPSLNLDPPEAVIDGNPGGASLLHAQQRADRYAAFAQAESGFDAPPLLISPAGVHPPGPMAPPQNLGDEMLIQERLHLRQAEVAAAEHALSLGQSSKPLEARDEWLHAAEAADHITALSAAHPDLHLDIPEPIINADKNFAFIAIAADRATSYRGQAAAQQDIAAASSGGSQATDSASTVKTVGIVAIVGGLLWALARYFK